MIFLLIIVFTEIILFEAPKLIQKKYWRELKIFYVFLFIAFVIALLQTIGIEIPNPAVGIQFLIKDVLHLDYK